MVRIQPRLIDEMRDAGLDVRAVSGCWSGAESGELSAIDGVIVHATAGSSSATDSGELGVILNGSNTAPPPISQFMLGRTGIVYFVRSGKCFHARNGFDNTRFEGIGNSRLIGIEGCNNNRGEDWSRSYPKYVTMVAVICRHFGWDPFDRVRGHKEHQPGDKSDPTFDMNEFRHRVAAKMAELAASPAAPTPAPVPEKADDDMREYLLLLRNTADNPLPGGHHVWIVERPYHPDPVRRWEEFSDANTPPNAAMQQAVGRAGAGENTEISKAEYDRRKALYATGGQWADQF